MGRLRDDYECALFNSVSEEVVDLFGIDGAKLYKYLPADNITNRDPLWDEPSPHVRYKVFEVKCMFLDYHDAPNESPEGFHTNFENKIYIALNHLLKAGVASDLDNEYISEGDMIFVFDGKREFYYDVLNVDRTGWINDTSQFTGYELDVKRNGTFAPERKIS